MIRNPTLALALVLAAPALPAANAPFQDFFFAVCRNPTAALAQRCAETPDAGGNLSGDSESSLNPSQALGQNRSRQDLDVDRRRGTSTAGRVDLGPWAVQLFLRHAEFARGRGQTLAEERALDGDARGLGIGVDYRWSDRFVFGALLASERLDHEFATEVPGNNFAPQSRAGSADVDQWSLGLHAAIALSEATQIDFGAGLSRSDGRYLRFPVFQESRRQRPQVNGNLAGDADGRTWFASLAAQHRVGLPAFDLVASGGLTLGQSRLDGYAERDLNASGLAMRFESVRRGSRLGHLGLSVERAFSTPAGVLLPRLWLRAQHEFDDDPEAVVARFLLDPSQTRFRLAGEKPDSQYVEWGASLVAVLAEGWAAYVEHARLAGRDDLDRHRTQIGIRREL